MRASKTQARLRAGEVVKMCSLGHFNPPYVRHAAHYGFDCIWLDLEHRLIEDRDVLALLAFAHLANIDIMIRPSTLEKSRLYRYLEDGAAGLMIPHVSTPEKARQLVDAVKFPPVGDRGLDGAGLDGGFWIHEGRDYPSWANRETFLVVQIETPQGVENAEQIAAVDGVDALFVGPGDLGLRLKLGTTQLTLEAAYQQVATAARRHGKAWGGPVGSAHELQQRRDQGAQVLPRGGDYVALMQALEAWGREY